MKKNKTIENLTICNAYKISLQYPKEKKQKNKQVSNGKTVIKDGYANDKKKAKRRNLTIHYLFRYHLQGSQKPKKVILELQLISKKEKKGVSDSKTVVMQKTKKRAKEKECHLHCHVQGFQKPKGVVI